MNVMIISALCPVITLLHFRFVINLIRLLVLVLATTLVMSRRSCMTLEQKQHRYLTTGVSGVSLIVFSMTFTHALHHTLFALSPFFLCAASYRSCCTLSEPWKAQLRVSLPLRVLAKIFAHNMWNPLMKLLFHDQISGAFEPFVDEIDLFKIALSCHFTFDVHCHKEGVHVYA